MILRVNLTFQNIYKVKKERNKQNYFINTFDKLLSIHIHTKDKMTTFIIIQIF